MASTRDLSGYKNLEEQLFVGALVLQKIETTKPEEDRPNNITIDFDTEDQTVSISLTLDTYTATVDGKAQIGVKEYLSEFVENPVEG